MHQGKRNKARGVMAAPAAGRRGGGGTLEAGEGGGPHCPPHRLAGGTLGRPTGWARLAARRRWMKAAEQKGMMMAVSQ